MNFPNWMKVNPEIDHDWISFLERIKEDEHDVNVQLWANQQVLESGSRFAYTMYHQTNIPTYERNRWLANS
jgi:hypothetical protein